MMQVYVLKELRKSHPLEVILEQCETGALGRNLEALRILVGKFPNLSDTRSLLGFDPFAKYTGHTKAKQLIQDVHGDKAPAEKLVERDVLFATASMLYFPRSLRPDDDITRSKRAIQKLSDAWPYWLDQSNLGRLVAALATNEFPDTIPAELKTSLQVHHSDKAKTAPELFAMSLAIHLIGVLGEEETANCPFATYIFYLDTASHDFMLASPAN